MHSHSLEKKLQKELEHQFSGESRRIIVGVSGGADSVALLRAIHSLQNEMQLEIWIAHFDHQTRNGQSHQDAIWVEQLTRNLQLNYMPGKASPGNNISEEALREQRLNFLIETARQKQADFICLAHHADDQVETVLHHIVRGTGLQGLMGIPAHRPVSDNITLLHPMLQIRKSEILDYLQAINQNFCTDATNENLQYTRNRIRHQLLPLLDELNPQASTHLIQLSQQIEETHRYLKLEAEKLFKKCVISINNDLVRLDATALKADSAVIVRELFRSIWEKLRWPRKKMALTHWNKLALFVQNTQTRIEFPAAITVIKRGEMIVLERKG